MPPAEEPSGGAAALREVAASELPTARHTMRQIHLAARGTERIKLLLVDDDPAFRRLSARAFRAPDVDLVAVASAREGLRQLEEADGDEPFDLLVLDVDLPGRKGSGLLQHLRSHGQEIPIVLLSERGDVRHKVRGLELGADDYVVKPCSFDELLSRLRAVLRRSTAGWYRTEFDPSVQHPG